MNDIASFFHKLFDTEDWPARWNCGHWTGFHGWLYIISDLLIWAAYFTLPVIILQIALRKRGLRFYSAYIWFAAFILFCGATHLLDALIFWTPMYRLSAFLRLITAVVSWLTIYHVVKLLPNALSLKTIAEFEAEIKRGNDLLKELERSHKEQKRQKDFSEKIISSSLDYILVFDEDLKILMLNEKTESLLQKTEAELKGKYFLDVFPDQYDSEYLKNVRLAASGQLISNVISQAPSGRYYDTSFVPLEIYGSPYAALVIARDITESIKREKSLETLNQTLYEQNTKLQNANHELEQFAYILSHDLQEPLRKIQIFSKMLIEKNNAGKMEDAASYLEKIDKSAGRMKTLIEDVLDYARTSVQSGSFVKTDLNLLVPDILSDLEIYIRERNAQVDFAPLPVIDCIPAQIRQALYNLVHNSVKYSVEQPRILVGAEKIIDDRGRNCVNLIVRDNGIGFEMQYRKDIFSIFKRLQNRDDYPGTGIGLALVKKIAENHKGSVSAESVPGKGSVFTLQLPVEQK